MWKMSLLCDRRKMSERCWNESSKVKTGDFLRWLLDWMLKRIREYLKIFYEINVTFWQQGGENLFKTRFELNADSHDIKQIMFTIILSCRKAWVSFKQCYYSKSKIDLTDTNFPFSRPINLMFHSPLHEQCM